MAENGFTKLKKRLSNLAKRLRGKSETEVATPSSKRLSDERMEELIDKIANVVEDYGMEQPAIFYVSLLKPFWPLVLPFGYMSVPLLDVFGFDVREYVRLLEKVENIKRLEYKIKEKYEKREKL